MRSNFFRFIVLRLIFGALFLPMTAFAAPAAPFALTYAPDYITENSVRLNGRVNTNETQDTEYWFEWSFAGKSETYNTQKIRIGGLADVNTTLLGLHPDTSYTYRLVAENSRGIDRGQTTYFTTKKLTLNIDPEIRVMTLDPVNITDTSAKLRAYVSPHGSSNTTYWFQWGTDATLAQSSYRASIGGSSGIVEYVIPTINSGTTYFFRVMGENAHGKQYGQVKFFTTTGIKPSADSSTDTSASGSGVAVSDRINEVDQVSSPNGVSIAYSWNVASGNPEFAIYYGTTSALGLRWTSGPVAQRGEYRTTIPFHPSGNTLYYQAMLLSGTKKIVSPVGKVERATLPVAGNSNSVAGSVNSGALVPQTPSINGVPSSGNTPSGSGTSGTGNTLPTNPFAFLFGKGNSTGTSSAASEEQAAAAGTAGGGFFSFFQKDTSSKSVDLLTSSEGERKAHSTMEYTIRYANNTNTTISGTVLKVIFPKNVIYIGDNTSNEFMVEDASGSGERVYVLSVGDVKPKEGRTITMLGMLTNDTANAAVRARLFYTTNGSEKTLASRAVDPEDIVTSERGGTIAVDENVPGESVTKESEWSIFPTTFFGWIFLALLVALGVVGFHKGKEYYLRKKAEFEEEEKKWKEKSA